MAHQGEPAEVMWLADWRRRMSDLYAAVRQVAASDPPSAWQMWREERERLFRQHPQSPVPGPDREGFRAIHWPYDDALRFTVAVEGPEASALAATAVQLPSSGVDVPSFGPAGVVSLALPGGPARLPLYWLAGYAGGLFLPFRDVTNGVTTYGAGRYVLDTAKGADLGGDPAAGTLVVDLNFAYHPSCAFDPRWSCPLAPPANRIAASIEAGERLR